MFLSIDTEFAGINGSLLQVGLALFDKQGKKINSKLLNVKPDDDIYSVNPKGLKINRINLIEHNDIAKPYKFAKKDLYELLEEYCKQSNVTRLIPIGKGIDGDIELICQYLISKNSFYSFVRYDSIDLASLYYADLIIESGVDTSIVTTIDTSLDSIATFILGNNCDYSKLHSCALYDAEITAECIFYLLSKFRHQKED